MGVEQHLNNLFAENAHEALKTQRGERFSYKLYHCVNGSFFSKVLKSQGICEVVNRTYSRSEDCDIITIKDVDTNERFSQNQFLLELE